MIVSIEKYIQKKQGSKLPCFCYSKTNSTNYIAKSFVDEGKIIDKALIVASSQTAGRGRYERSFLSPNGGIYMSYVLNVQNDDQYAAFGLYSSLAVVNMLLSFIDENQHSITVKWPNDVLVDGKKICGILPESVEKDGKRFVIIGIGVNINTSKKYLTGLEDIATSLTDITGKKYDIDKLTAMLAIAIEDIKDMYFGRFTNELNAEYNARSSTIGKHISYTNSEGKLSYGNAIKVNVDGSLVIKNDGKEDIISWGEITENA